MTLSKITKQLCSIQGCEGLHKGLSYCSKHWQRYKKYGDAEAPVKRGKRHWTPEQFNAKFWERVNVQGQHECWEWLGHLNRYGYGQVKHQRKTRTAHRVMWFLIHGSFPESLILHSCDNRKCVNPNHLRLGSAQDNVDDREQRNRGYRGGHWWNAKRSKEYAAEQSL